MGHDQMAVRGLLAESEGQFGTTKPLRNLQGNKNRDDASQECGYQGSYDETPVPVLSNFYPRVDVDRWDDNDRG
jgi:hypothetical protein